MHLRLNPVGAIPILAIVAVGTILPALSAEDLRSVPVEAEVRQLIGELGAPTRAARAAAEKRLLEIGPSILPQLPPPELLASVSVRESVDRIRQELERRQARDSIQASTVTLGGTRPLRDWLTEIGTQTRNELDGSDLPDSVLDRPLSLEVEDREFWPVVDDVLRQTGVAIEPRKSRRGLRLIGASEERPELIETVGYAGPFRLWALPAEIIVPIRPIGGRVPRRLLRVLLFVQPEPRLRPLFLQFASSEITAESDRVEIKSFNPDASFELAVNEPGGQSRLQLDFDLQPELTPEKIDLRGTFRMTIAAGRAEVRFIDIAKQANGKPLEIDRRRGGVTVTLRRIERERKGDGTQELRVAITVAYDSGGPAFESHRTWILHNEVFLEAGDSRVPLNGGFETTLQADGAVGMEYRFLNLPDPLPEYKFVYVAPTLIVDVPVRFALESLPVRGPK